MNRIQKILITPAIALLVACCLSACGFYLKGRSPLPPELSTVYIDYEMPYEVVKPQLQAELETQLEQRGANVTRDATAATSTIAILDLNETQRTQSVGPTAKPIEYQLVTDMEFEFRVAGKVRIPHQTLTVQRDYSFDETQLLAKEEQREKLQREMQRDLAGLIMLRLDAELRKPAPPAGPASAGR